MKTEEVIERKYYPTFGEIKKALGIKGELHSSQLWAGLSPCDEEQGKSRDQERIEIITREKLAK